MAGMNFGALGQGFFQGQDQAQERLMMQMKIKQLQEQQARDAQVRQGMGAGINALQMPPPPGQQSQPMQPPLGTTPQRPPQGQQMPAQQGPQMGGQPMFNQMAAPPQQLGAPGGQPPMRPYTSPQPPQQQPQGGGQGLPPPPQQQGQQGMSQMPNLPQLMKKLTEQGMDPETAFQVAQRFEPMLSQEGKMQLAAANSEIKRLQAEASMQRAGTGAGELERKKEIDAGTSKLGAANIAKTEAQTKELGARAAKENRSGGTGGGGAGAANPAKSDFYLAMEVGGNHDWKTRMPQKEVAAIMQGFPAFAKEHGISPEEIGTAAASRKALTATLRNVTNRSEAVELFSNKLEKDMASLDKLLDKAAPTGPMFANQPINALRRQFNDPALAQLDLQARQVGTEYERLITSGGLSQAQLHRGAQEDAKGLLSGDFPPQKTRAVLKQIAIDMNNARSAAKETKKNIQDELTGLGKSGADKPKPTQADRDAAKKLPGGKEQFKAHFGEEP